MGPWSPAGVPWDCGMHDICNGAFLEDGSYAYVATITFPYVFGCYGPAAPQRYKAACSGFTCDASQSYDENEVAVTEVPFDPNA